jgi:hypothetical protein
MEMWALTQAEINPEGFSDFLKIQPEVVAAVPSGAVPAAVASAVDIVALTDTRQKIAERLGLDADKVFGITKQMKG